MADTRRSEVYLAVTAGLVPRSAKAQDANRPVWLYIFCGVERMVRRRACAVSHQEACAWLHTLDRLASGPKPQMQTKKSRIESCRREKHSHEIADLRHAGHRVSAACLQPLPRRGRRRQPGRRIWRARRHRTLARVDRAGTEMDRRSR